MTTAGDAAFVRYLESIMDDPDLSLGAKHVAIRRALANRGGDTEPYQHYLQSLQDQMAAGDTKPAQPQGGASSSDSET